LKVITLSGNGDFMPTENGTDRKNGKKKWTEWASVRLGLIVLLISVTTFFNQIYISKSNTIKTAAQFEERFDIACKKVDLLEKRIDVLEKQFVESNLKMEIALTRIETSLNLVLKKLQ
jgi:hypothetical protein